MTDELLTQAQFATLVGVSAPRINKLVKANRLPLVNKKIPKEAGLKAWSNREMGYEKAAIAGKKYGGDPRKTKGNGMPRTLTEDDEDENSIDPSGDDEWASRFKIARTLEKEEMARKRKLENEVEEGRWVLKTDVKQEASALAGAIKQKLISIAPIIAVTAEGKTGLQIQKIVEFHINEVLKQLQELEK